MKHAYDILFRAMALCGWSHLYSKVTLNSGDIYELNYYSDLNNDRDYALCQIVRGILFGQVSELYQTLK